MTTFDDQSAAYVYPNASGTAPWVVVYSAPVDLGSSTVLRLDLTISALEDRDATGNGTADPGQLSLAIEHGPTNAGPWTELAPERRYAAAGSDRFVLGPCDRYVRTRRSVTRGRAKYLLNGTVLP